MKEEPPNTPLQQVGLLAAWPAVPATCVADGRC